MLVLFVIGHRTWKHTKNQHRPLVSPFLPHGTSHSPLDSLPLSVNPVQSCQTCSSRSVLSAVANTHTHTIADWVSPELILSGRSVIKWGRGGKKNMIFPLNISDAVIREQTWCRGILPSWKSPSTRWSYTWICPAIVAELEFYSFKDIYIVALTHANVPALEMINTCCYVVEWF